MQRQWLWRVVRSMDWIGYCRGSGLESEEDCLEAERRCVHGLSIAVVCVDHRAASATAPSNFARTKSTTAQ